MKNYLVSLDLMKIGHDYKDLRNKLANFEAYWHCLDSTWIVKTDITPEELRNSLQLNMENDDKLLVVELAANASWAGFGADCSDWLTDNI